VPCLSGSINYSIVQGRPLLKSFFMTSEPLPWTVVVDAAGNVHTPIEGIMYADEFTEKLQPLLRPKQPRLGTR
jgi:hypothetical protein